MKVLRRVSVALILSVLVFLVVSSSSALDVKGGFDTMAVSSSGHEFTSTSTSLGGLPDGYTVYSKGGESFYITRVMGNEGAEAISIYVCAGESILIPAPEMVNSSGTYTQTFYVSAHTDSVFALPWRE